jgi:5-dehydro-2-deoxygluconokinase
MLNDSIFKSGELCVVGNINRDLKTAPVLAGAYLFQDGETSVAGIHETIGGGGANSAAIAASLGAGATFIGQIGADALGKRLKQTLRAHGVRCCLHENPKLPTGTTLNLVYASGHRHFLSCHPNNAALGFEQLDLRPLERGGHLLRADVWFSEPMLYGGNERLFRAARKAGLAISIDLNWDPKWGCTPAEEILRRQQAVRNLLPLVDLAHGNVRELKSFAAANDLPSALRRLEGWGANGVVVHLGAKGAGYYARGQWLTVKPTPVRKHQMATGTGDVLSVCMMLMHHQTNIPVRQKLRLANSIVAQFMEGRRPLIPALKT